MIGQVLLIAHVQAHAQRLLILPLGTINERKYAPGIPTASSLLEVLMPSEVTMLLGPLLAGT